MVSVPTNFVASVAARLRRLFGGGKSAKEIRAKDQDRQSRARRELRGLSSKHDQSAHEPTITRAGQAPKA